MNCLHNFVPQLLVVTDIPVCPVSAAAKPAVKTGTRQECLSYLRCRICRDTYAHAR